MIEVDQEVRPNSLKSSKKVLISSSVQTFLLYFTISVIGYFTIYQENHEGLDNYLIFLMSNEKFKSNFFIVANILVAFGSLFGNALNFFPLVNFFNVRLNQNRKKISLKMLMYISMDENEIEDPELVTEEFLKLRKKRNRVKIVIYLFTIVLLTLIMFSLCNMSMDWLFTFVSAFTVPPISFIFPFLLYRRIIQTGVFEERTKMHLGICAFTLVLGAIIWLFTLVCLVYTKLNNLDNL